MAQKKKIKFKRNHANALNDITEINKKKKKKKEGMTGYYDIAHTKLVTIAGWWADGFIWTCHPPTRPHVRTRTLYLYFFFGSPRV
jgi:hypothetical protein